MKQKGLAINRESMQTYGLYIFQEKGQYWLNKELAKRFPAEGNIVIDGMRHPEDYTFMIETFGPNFYFMFVNANYELRKERYNKMGFNVSDCKKVFNHDVESNIKKIQNKYDYLIENEGSIDDLKKNVYEIIKILK
jgi:dephospho-CoA kinase